MENFGPITTQEIERRSVRDGKLFSVSKRITSYLTSSAVFYVLIDPTACTCEDLIFIPPKFSAFGAGPIEIDIFQNPTYSGGTPFTPGNRKLASSNPAELVFKVAPTVTDVGTQLPFEFVIMSKSSSTPVTTSIGGSTQDDLFFEPNQDNIYLFRLTNTEAANTTAAHMAFNWIES